MIKKQFWWSIAGFLAGVIIGIFAPLTIPIAFARYSAVAIMVIVDAIFGAFTADLKEEYSPSIFISGLLFGMTAAILITFLGDRLGIDLYLAVIIVFTFRIFANLSTIRYAFLTRFLGRKKVEEKIQERENTQ